MFIANMYDPVTSVGGAQNASAGFSLSRVLINEGHGVSSHQVQYDADGNTDDRISTALSLKCPHAP